MAVHPPVSVPIDLGGPVTVTRDTWGIAHARAATAHGAFWAQGWVAADDRLWQMEWDRRRGLGRWAEVVGRAAVREDAFFRRLDLATAARADWAALAPATRAMTEAYARGVNGWLETPGRELPPEFAHHPAAPEPWEPWHCLLVYKVRHLFMGTLHRKLWRGAVVARAGVDAAVAMAGDPLAETPIVADGVGGVMAGRSADTAPTGVAIGPDHLELLADAEAVVAGALSWLATVEAGSADGGAVEGDGASNSWAVAGSRTASGLPLLAGDPHRGIEFPNVYHQFHLACDVFDAIGLGFPGVPGFPHFGHNESVAWCITHGMADDTDVFVEAGPVTVDRVERIEVRDEQPVEVRCARTDRGPVVLGDPDGPGPSLSMAWTGLHGPDSTFDCLWPMLGSGSVAEVEAAVDRWVIPVNSMLSADTAGTISYRVRGRLVDRPPVSRWVPVPGDGAHAWGDRAPVADDRLPRWRNPERGFLVTANNLIARSGPYISLDFASSARHDRIVELLETTTAATVDDMTVIHRDVRSLVAPSMIQVFGQARPTTELGRAVLARLADWDATMDGAEAPPLIYTALRLAWADEVGARLAVTDPWLAEAGWPAPVHGARMLFEGASTLARTGRWSAVPGVADDLAATLGTIVDRVAADLAAAHGPDPDRWRWDGAHTMVCPHPLAAARPEAADLHPPADGCGGDGDTVRAASVNPSTGARAATSSVARYAFDLADWDRSGWVVPHGVSGVRGSGHDLDQRPAWLAGQLLPMVYSPGAVAAAAVGTERLTPR